jgi:LmbE family N-acetylglucosaminyl deacetylase
MTGHFYLSPHLDDAVLSCGGLIASQVAAGETVVVLTACAGDPPPGPLSDFAQELLLRWGKGSVPSPARRAEDRMACGRLGASVLHFDVPDAIYRRQTDGTVLYPSERAIFGPVHLADKPLIDSLAAKIAAACPEDSRLYSPLGIGNHVDHLLTRLAAERAHGGLWYYPDFPYIARGGASPDLPVPPGQKVVLPLSSEEVQTWAAAAAEYASQISTFWSDVYALYEEVRDYAGRTGGIELIAP